MGWKGQSQTEALTVYDRKGKIIILSDPQAAIAAIRNVGQTGKASTGELRKVIKKIEEGKKAVGPNIVTLGRVKSHIGIKGKEEGDKEVKLGANEEDPAFPVITEGGLKEAWKKMREEERFVKGTGEGRVVKWERKGRLCYVHCRTNKGNPQSWRHKWDNTKDPACRFCCKETVTRKHVALICPYREEIG